MHNLRAFGLVLFSFLILAIPAFARSGASTSTIAEFDLQQQQQIVESVDIQGNRRLRDEDLMYYIKTRPGDVYDPAALERDLKNCCH